MILKAVRYNTSIDFLVYGNTEQKAQQSIKDNELLAQFKAVEELACSQRCTNNLLYARKNGYAPPANMEELTKPKNVKDVVKGWIGVNLKIGFENGKLSQ